MAAPPQQRDLTSGPIARTLLLFALPTLGSNILQSLNGSINSIWIGQFLGEAAIAATANANIIMFLMFALVFGLGMAATILIAQAVGRRDIDAARRVVGTTMGVFVALSITVVVIGWTTTPGLLQLLGTPADVYPLALTYLRFTFLGVPPMLLSTMMTMALRGAGDALTPFWFMAVSVVGTIVLNPLFIVGFGPIPALGIAGAAVATMIANYAMLIGLTIYIYARDLPIRLRGEEFRYLFPDRRLLGMVSGRGLAMGLQMVVGSLSGLAMMGLVNRQGTVTVAAFGAASQLWTYIQMPAMAVGGAVSAMAAQNIGAGRWDRVGRITRSGLMMSLVLTGGLVLMITLFDRPALSLFLGGDAVAIGIGRHINLLVAWGFILFGAMLVFAAAVRANGVVLLPLAFMVIALFPVRFTVALALQPWLGTDALWYGFVTSFGASLAMNAAYYRWGGWRESRVTIPPPREEALEQTLAQGEPAGQQHPVG